MDGNSPSPTSPARPAPFVLSHVTLLYAARGLRGFGDGFAIIILPAYLAAIGYEPVLIGIVATASLLGTALLTLVVGMIAPRYDLRTLLLFGAGLMVATGLAFPSVEHIASSCWWRSRHHQPVDRRSRRAGADRACHAGARRLRRGAHHASLPATA